jgi:spore coat protein U-like protein
LLLIRFLVTFFLLILSVISQAACTGTGCNCTASAATTAFGNYYFSDSSPNDTTGNVQVICSAEAPSTVSYVITLNMGNAGSFSPRQMTNGANTLNYNLYTDAGRTLIWGDGTSGTNTVSDAYNLSVSSQTNNYTIYARIAASQSPAVGAYSDAISVTVEF